MTSPSPVWVRLIAAIEPTALDPNRYAAGSTWHMPANRAAALVEAEVAEYCEPPAAATRVVTEPLEPAAPVPEVIPAPAEFAAEEE
jgi:hypothetical protein